MTKRLLIIGAGKEQIQAYQIAKKMGLIVVGTDRNPNAPAFDYADDKLICSTRDAQFTLETVLEFSKKKPIDGVMTIANDVPYTVALVAHKLGLPGIPLRSAEFAKNKILMKKQFQKHDIPTPKFEMLETENDYFKKISNKKFPLILKPSDGRGSRGVLYLENTTELKWAWDYVYYYSDNKTLMLEEYIKGDQLSVEGIFVKEKFYTISISDRNYNNLMSTKPYIVEDGGVIPTKHGEIIRKKCSALVESAARSLGIKFGSVKADIVISDNNPMIIELAARLSGNYLATHHIPIAYGVNIVKAVINLSLGNEINEKDLIPRIKKYLGVRYFFPKPGKIMKILGMEEVKSLEYVNMLEFFRKVGEEQPIIAGHVDRAGTIICEGESYEEALFRVEDARNRIKFVIS